MKYTNKNNLPEEIVRAVQQDTYSKGEASISVTGLLSAPRPNILAREHHNELVVDVSDEIWKILGTASHYIMEQANIGHEGTITEERLYWNVRGWTISGQFDAVSLKDAEHYISVSARHIPASECSPCSSEACWAKLH